MTNEEIWKAIKGYEGLYEVSNTGKVRSLDQTQYRFNGKSMCHFRIKGRILKGRITGDKKRGQYYSVMLCKDGSQKQKKIHRLVAEAFVPNPNKYPQIDHLDGNKFNNDFSNLEWVTCKENINRSWDTGLRSGFGENSSKAKLKRVQVEEIKNLYVKGDSKFGAKPLGRKYNVSPSAIKDIVEGKSWIRK